MKLSLVISILFFSLTSQAALKIAQYNIRNFDYDQRAHLPTDKNYLYETIKKMNPDFMSVEEIRETEVFKNFISKRFHGRYEVALSECGGAHDQRLGFVFDKTKFKLLSFNEDLRTSNPNNQRDTWCYEGSRPLAIGIFLNLATQEKMVAIAAHLKSGGQDSSIKKRFKQIEIIGTVVKSYRSQGIKNFVVMGDLNSTEYIFKGKEYRRFIQAFSDMGLIDLAKDVECTSYWWGGIDDGRQYPSTLDHMLISKELKDKEGLTKARALGHCEALSCKDAPERTMGTSYQGVSDHCPLLAE